MVSGNIKILSGKNDKRKLLCIKELKTVREKIKDKGKPVFYGLYFRLPLNKIWYNKIGLFDKFRYFTISSQADVDITKYAYRSNYNSRICFVTLTDRQKFDVEIGETWYQLKKHKIILFSFNFAL